MKHMFNIYRLSILLSFACFPCMLFAQKAERENVRKGNKLYQKEKYTESEIAYRKSLEVNPKSEEGTYNLGNALYKQGKFPEASEQYQITAGQEKNTEKLAQTFHNMGNIFMQNKDYAKSVQMYRQSLRLSPKDDETRYNLALAQKLLEDQQQQNQDQDQNKDENEDKKDQEQQQDQNKDQQQDKNQQQQDNKKEDKTQQEKQQNEQMSEDNAQQMLDAFLQDEKDTQEKVKKAQMQQHQRRKSDKEW